MFKARMETFKTPHFSTHLLPLSLLPSVPAPFGPTKKRASKGVRKGWKGKGGSSAYNRGLVGAAETSQQRNGGGGGEAREAGEWIQIG